jgi:hypothetical protein
MRTALVAFFKQTAHLDHINDDRRKQIGCEKPTAKK